MEINIKLMTEEAYKTLQKNYDDVYKMIAITATQAIAAKNNN